MVLLVVTWEARHGEWPIREESLPSSEWVPSLPWAVARTQARIALRNQQQAVADQHEAQIGWINVAICLYSNCPCPGGQLPGAGGEATRSEIMWQVSFDTSVPLKSVLSPFNVDQGISARLAALEKKLAEATSVCRCTVRLNGLQEAVEALGREIAILKSER